MRQNTLPCGEAYLIGLKGMMRTRTATVFHKSTGERSYENTYYFIVDNKYIKLPYWLTPSIIGEDKITATSKEGIWSFVNGFERTEQGRYLIRIEPYYHKLKPDIFRKVAKIQDMYSRWVIKR